jgi:hypothetical protein
MQPDEIHRVKVPLCKVEKLKWFMEEGLERYLKRHNC